MRGWIPERLRMRGEHVSGCTWVRVLVRVLVRALVRVRASGLALVRVRERSS